MMMLLEQNNFDYSGSHPVKWEPKLINPSIVDITLYNEAFIAEWDVIVGYTRINVENFPKIANYF